MKKTVAAFGIIAILIIGVAFRSPLAKAFSARASSHSAVTASTAPRAASVAVVPAESSLSIELGEDDVTQLLRAALRAQGMAADDLQVRLENGHFVATTVQHAGFLPIPVTIDGTAAITDGQLSVRAVSVNAAGVPVPQDLIDRVTGSLEAALAQSIGNLPIRPTDLEILPGRVVVQGAAK